MVLDVPRGLWLSPKGLTHGPQGEDAHTNGVAGATLEGVQRYNRRCSSTHGITADLIKYPVELRGARGGGAKEDGAQRNGAQRNGAQNEDGAQRNAGRVDWGAKGNECKTKKGSGLVRRTSLVDPDGWVCAPDGRV